MKLDLSPLTNVRARLLLNALSLGEGAKPGGSIEETLASRVAWKSADCEMLEERGW